MKRAVTRLALALVLAASVGVRAGHSEVASRSVKPADQLQSGSPASHASASRAVADTLEQAFIQIGEQAGPAVVSISTEQIEQVQRYFRGHPFIGQEPFDEFFRDFFGDMAPPGASGPGGQQFRRFGLGSGVIIDQHGLILTNEHVVAEADKISVTLADGREFSGQVTGKDARADLAIVKIDAKDLPVARLGDSDNLKVGQWAIALGNPFGLVGPAGSETLGTEPTLTVGVISALHRRLPKTARAERDYSDLIQTDAAINPGNSGGPLLNSQGEIIGINVAILTSSRGFEGVGFAIPVNRAKAILDALIEGRRILYGWLGIQIQDITSDVAEYYGVANDRQGVLVYQVLPGSPAQQAGLRDGDIIKNFDGVPVKNARDLVDVVGRAKVGRRVPVEALREGKRAKLDVEVGERPAEGQPVAVAVGEAWRGISVAELTPQVAEQFNLNPSESGVLITEVKPDSSAADAHLQPGDVINEINRMPIGSLADYRQAIAKVQDNALVRTQRGYVVVKSAP